MSSEFVPFEDLRLLARYWWVMVVAALLGGMIGFTVTRQQTPVYEAVATFFVSVDLNKIPNPPLSLHDEDLALATAHAVIIAPETLQYVLEQAAGLGLSLDTNTLLANTTVERRNAFWELRYRSIDPHIAQALVNVWAEKAYEQYQIWKQDGRAVPYIVYSVPTLAGLPVQAVQYDTNRLVLAGSVVGWAAGIFLCELIGQRKHSAL